MSDVPRCYLCLMELTACGICAACRRDLDVMVPKARMEVLVSMQQMMASREQNELLASLVSSIDARFADLADAIDCAADEEWDEGDEWKLG